jgi:long-subunit fatty acid transport protein
VHTLLYEQVSSILSAWSHVRREVAAQLFPAQNPVEAARSSGGCCRKAAFAGGYQQRSGFSVRYIYESAQQINIGFMYHSAVDAI